VLQVIQIYISWPSTNLPVPKLQLAAFSRQTIAAGQHKLVNLAIAPERIAIWGDNGWTYVKGIYVNAYFQISSFL